MSSGAFYVGTWFVPRFDIPVQQDWRLPLDGDLQHIKDTSNVEELHINPEDMDELPDVIQAGLHQWVTFSTSIHEFYSQTPPGFGGFYFSSVPGVGGFYLLDVGI